MIDDAWLGLDPAAVAGLERELALAATAVRRATDALARGVETLRWSGDDRARLQASVARIRSRGGAATQQLRRAESLLRRSREAQVRCSRGGHGGSSIARPARPFRWDDLVAAGERDLSLAALDARRADAARWAEVSGVAMLERLLEEPDPGLAASWWRGLDDDQRSALEELQPGLLSGVLGLPAGVIARAARRYLDERQGELVAEVREIEGSAGASVPLKVVEVDLGVDLGATITRYRDGRVEVTVHFDTEMGASGRAGRQVDAAVAAGTHLRETFGFDDADAADRFVQGLGRAALSTGGSLIGLSLGAALGGVRLPTDPRAVDRYLGSFREHRVGRVLGGSAGARVDGGNANVAAGELDGSGGIEREWRRGSPAVTTAFAEGSLDLRALGNDIEGTARVALQSADDGSRTLLLTGTAAGRQALENLADLASPGVQVATDTSGGSIAFEARMAVTPATEELFARLARSPSQLLDPGQLRTMVQHADLTIRTSEQTATRSTLDALVVDAERSEVVSTTARTWIKAPHGRLIELR